jgi:lysozyme
MKTSDQGIAAIVQREGYRNKAYKDTKGIWTCGVGCTGPDVYEGVVWTDQQVKEALGRALKASEDAVNTVVYPLSQNQFDALVSFVFNVGVTAFNKSTMKKYINLGKIVNAAAEFDKWNIPKEIIGRRMSEKAAFLKAQ